MDYSGVEFFADYVIIKDVRHFLPAHIFECGQMFRFSPMGTGYEIFAGDKRLFVEKAGEDVKLFPCTREDFKGVWHSYLDLGRDYAAVCEGYRGDEKLKLGIEHGAGVRILNQQPFETLISFIISANNNIGRIKGIIARLCQKHGSPIEGGYAFPTPQQLRDVPADSYAALGCGYRAPYLEKTVRAINGGFPLDVLRNLTYPDAKRELLKLAGVGPKVADCILLFSLGHSCAFPVDVWMGRIMREYMGEATLPAIQRYAAERFGENAGIAQQYLFFYARENKIKGLSST